MCGFVAIARPSGLEIDERGPVLDAMRDALHHRGPDDATSAVFDNWVGLAHRRLSIIDLDGSRQPLTNEDRSIACVFNGEIYNFKELRAELAARGHRFRTNGDGEVIVHGYEQWGLGVCSRLEGMFTFALFDRVRGEVIAVRDRFGIKPLFWTRQGDGILWSSELKGLLAHPAVPRRASRRGLALGLTRTHSPWPYTAFDGIFRQPPGSWLRVTRRAEVEMQRFAPMVEHDAPAPRCHDDVLDQAESVLKLAVERQLVADVPVGAFLSGGIDSTLIVAMMKRLGASPIHTFSVGVDRARDDESAVAARTARALGTTHHEVRMAALSFADLVKIPEMVDEPFAELSIIALRVLSRLAREHVRVALSGDGGDEVFGGYNSYRIVGLSASLRRAAGRSLGDGLGASAEHLLRARPWPGALRKALRFGALLGAEAAPAHRAITSQGWVGAASGQRSSECLSASLSTLAAGPSAPDDPIRAAMWSDRVERLPNAMLTKVDAASMAESLEVRVPMLDDRVVQFAAGLERRDLASARWGKLLLRRLLARVFPEGPAWQEKRGFALPIDRWLRLPDTARQMEDLFGGHGERVEQLTGVDPVREWNDFLSGGSQLSAGTAGMRLVWLATVALWAEKWKVEAPNAVEAPALSV